MPIASVPFLFLLRSSPVFPPSFFCFFTLLDAELSMYLGMVAVSQSRQRLAFRTRSELTWQIVFVLLGHLWAAHGLVCTWLRINILSDPGKARNDSSRP